MLNGTCQRTRCDGQRTSGVLTQFRFMVQDILTEYAVRGVTCVQEIGLIACYGIFDVLPKVVPVH